MNFDGSLRLGFQTGLIDSDGGIKYIQCVDMKDFKNIKDSLNKQL